MNPINSSATNGQQVGVSPSNPINDPNFSSRQGSNTFDLSYRNLITARFGEITPFFYSLAIGRDRSFLRSSQDLRTFTLSSPLFSPVRMKKSYFSIPLKAIMPNTWDYIFVNPVKGNDIPDDALCSVNLLALAYNLASLSIAVSPIEPDGSDFSMQMRRFMLFYSIFSRGSLLDYLGISTSQFFDTDSFLNDSVSIWQAYSDALDGATSIDNWFDIQLSSLVGSSDPWSLSLSYSLSDHVNSDTFLKTFTIDNTSSASAVRQVFYLFLEHPDAIVKISRDTDNNDLIYNFLYTKVNTLLGAFKERYQQLSSSTSLDYSLKVNLFKVVAYQMACAQFFTNDHVDNVYSSSLWMSNMSSLAFGGSTQSRPTFRLNGVPVLYDVFSSRVLTSLYDFDPSVDAVLNRKFYFWFNLFTFRRSLRYGDYFCSSRPQPLAVGDVSVPVSGGNVSVIDVNKNLHIQRFLNAVNRVGSNIVEYAKGIFGYKPQAVDPSPNFISDEFVNIGTDEIDNTSAEQGQVNTNLVAQSSHYAFDVNFTDPSIIVGVISFDVLGAYPYTVERDNFHIDRYDMFNPFLQHIGDQDVNTKELGDFFSRSPFGYQVRYAEYKFKYSQQHGGFNDSLKSWSFPYRHHYRFLSEDFIRYEPTDFDLFYKSLTHYSLANYFHFQISFDNTFQSNRAMDFQPTLLG